MHGKNPTREQKIKLKAVYGLNPDNWLIQKNTPSLLQVVHRHTGTVRKFERS